MIVRQKFLFQKIFDDEGSTLVEVVVAMALLLTVLLPAGVFLGFIAHYPHNRIKVVALGKAQSAMERLIYRENYRQGEKTSGSDQGWQVKEILIPDANSVYIKVAVYRHEDKIITLSTVRFNYK